MMRTADMWRSTRKEHIVLYLVGGSDPSDPTPGELLKCYKAEDMEFKDWIEKKNIKLVGERLRICAWRTGNRVIIRIACVAGRMVTRGVLSWRRSREGKFQFDLLPNLSRLRRSAAKKQQHSPANPASRAG